MRAGMQRTPFCGAAEMYETRVGAREKNAGRRKNRREGSIETREPGSRCNDSMQISPVIQWEMK